MTNTTQPLESAVVSLRFPQLTKEEWELKNPVLQAGELGFELNTNKIKIGTGLQGWNLLEYVEADLSGHLTREDFDAFVQILDARIKGNVNSMVVSSIKSLGNVEIGRLI